MTVRTEIHASILPVPEHRNAAPPARAFPALSRSRARAPHAGPALVGIVWALVLASFVLAVAAPAAVMERRVAERRAAEDRIASARP